MSVYFGTDGIRGSFSCDDLLMISFACGKALAISKPNANILIGCDTRDSADLLMLMFSAGATCVGANVTSVGVCPTAGVSFLTSSMKFDFGVVISASHNPAEFNGIKIFDKKGRKITENFEIELEKTFFKHTNLTVSKKGRFTQNTDLIKKYVAFLQSMADVSLSGKTIVLDTANGSGVKIAPAVFKKLGAKVILISAKPNGRNINKNCGATSVKKLQNKVLSCGADMGFAFDGDSDRVVGVTENGRVVDGDQIVYLMANHFKKTRKLKNNTVVGTVLTNMGIERMLARCGIKLERVDVGDRNIGKCLEENDYLLGGEQSGHVIVKNKLATGDGILNAVLVASICVQENRKLSALLCDDLFCQCMKNVTVKNKAKIMQSQTLANAKQTEEDFMGESGRVLIRASGTESCIRVMAESKDGAAVDAVCARLAKIVHEIDLNGDSCVE